MSPDDPHTLSPDEMAKIAIQHINQAAKFLQALKCNIPSTESNDFEPYLASIVAFAVIILSEAPSVPARLRVQATANLLCKASGVEVDSTELHNEVQNLIGAHESELAAEVVGRLFDIVENARDDV